VSGVSSSYGTLVASVARDADGLVSQLVYGDAASTTTAMSYDGRRRLSSVQTYRGPAASWSQSPPAYSPAPTPGGPPSTFQLLLEDVDYHYDVVDNPVEIDDWRVPTEWPAGAQPVSRKVQYDDLYRATRVDYVYPGGTDPWTSPFAVEDTGSAPDPRLALPSPHVHFANRVLRQSFQYDWLGNTTQTDDDVHGFYDRSLGTVTNGAAGAGPYQLKAASDADPTLGGGLTAVYDAAGDLTSMAVTRSGPCLPSSAHCLQQFVYDWDEVGRLARARRWDLATAGASTTGVTPSADLSYVYDASDNRVIKAATDAAGNKSFSAYIFSSLELRRAAAGEGNDYVRNGTTEVAYLEAHGVRLARLHAAYESLPELGGSTLHVLLEMPDHLGSTSIVVDRDTSELVERGTYMAYGQAESDYRPPRWGSFREDYRFTGKEEDVEVGLAYFGKRYLASVLGRWASSDPLAIHALGADANAYAYVHGRLLGAVDAIGLASGEYNGGGVSFTATDEPATDQKAQDWSQQQYQVPSPPPASTGQDCHCSYPGMAEPPTTGGAQQLDAQHDEVRWNPNANNATEAMLLGSRRAATLRDTNPRLAADIDRSIRETLPILKTGLQIASMVQPEIALAMAAITIGDRNATTADKALAAAAVLPVGKLVGKLGALAAEGTWAAEALEAGATRRLATMGDTQFRTGADALAEALERHGIDPSTVETTTMYGKNPNLIGPQGQPWEMVRGLNSEGKIIEFRHDASGHFFGDTNEFELPHYHGPNGEHLTY
jgi:RHS repeat-associated protein